MAPRNEVKDGANGAEEPQPERGFATLATLRYVFEIAIDLITVNDFEHFADFKSIGSALKRWLRR